jgi:hypothetical protein
MSITPLFPFIRQRKWVLLGLKNGGFEQRLSSMPD